MRIHRTLSLSREEQDVISRAALSIRIAFDEVPDREDKNAWKSYQGRHLMAAARLGRDKLTPEQVHGAWGAVVTLAAVLEAQSDRAYWERELRPQPGERIAVTEGGGRFGLVAPGTDVCGMLAEIRVGQLREVRAALRLLQKAVTMIGLPEPTEIDESLEYT